MKLVVFFEPEVKLDKADLPFIISELQKIADNDIVKEVYLYGYDSD